MTSIKVNTFLTKHLTDNIMDYAPQGEESKEKYMQSTYKWQWDAVKDYADDTNIYRGLKKESE